MKYFLLRFLIPISTTRVKVFEKDGFRGFLRVYVFGIKVAQFQLTNPWD